MEDNARSCPFIETGRYRDDGLDRPKQYALRGGYAKRVIGADVAQNELGNVVAGVGGCKANRREDRDKTGGENALCKRPAELMAAETSSIKLKGCFHMRHILDTLMVAVCSGELDTVLAL